MYIWSEKQFMMTSQGEVLSEVIDERHDEEEAEDLEDEEPEEEDGDDRHNDGCCRREKSAKYHENCNDAQKR